MLGKPIRFTEHIINRFGYFVNKPIRFIYNMITRDWKGSDQMEYPRIRSLREDRDLLQKDLAEYLHCSQMSYSRYERGTHEIPTEVLCKLADFHNTSTDYLLGRTDDPRPYPRHKV